MSTILVWKEKLQTMYAKYAIYIEKTLQFILGLTVFGLINANIGYMKMASSFVCTIGLAAICAFLPLVVMVLAATALILAHLYALSMPVAGVAAAIFVIMYIFYFRFTPKKAWLVLLTPIAFAFHIPYLVPIALGLVATPIAAVPVAAGTIVYFMIHYVNTSSASLKASGADSMVTSLTTFTKQAIQNKEMWVTIIAFTVCLIIVYIIRTKSADHAWKVAIVTGAIINIMIIVIGDITLSVHISYIPLICGSIVAAAFGFVLEFFVFTVDYSRTERMQFEDDEYYYYVKAVPKLMVTAPKKEIRTINEHKETTTIDTDSIKRVAQKKKVPSTHKQNISVSQKQSVANWQRKNADEILFKKSLNEEFNRRTK